MNGNGSTKISLQHRAFSLFISCALTDFCDSFGLEGPVDTSSEFDNVVDVEAVLTTVVDVEAVLTTAGAEVLDEGDLSLGFRPSMGLLPSVASCLMYAGLHDDQ